MDFDGVPAVAAAGGVAVLLLLAWRARSRVVIARRLGVVTTRLEPAGTLDVSRRSRLEHALAAVEKAAGAAVAERQAAEAAADRLRAALDHIPSGVVVCDDRGRLVFGNDRARELLGTRHGQQVAEGTVGRLLTAAVGGVSRDESLELLGPPRRSLALAAFPLHSDAGGLGAVAVVDDLSERRRVEAVRRDFVANATDELRKPVAALAMLAEILHDEAEGTAAARIAKRVHREAKRVDCIVDDLVELSRLEAQEGAEQEPLVVATLVDDALAQMRDVAARRGVAITADEVSKRLDVSGNRRQLVRALTALLDNAVRHSDTGAGVAVDVRHTGQWVDISVTDAGAGIPTAHLHRIFERFYKVESESGDPGGSGLGLAIVKHVAESHRGDVLVESREGGGSTFTLRLPAGAGPAALSTEAG